MALEDFIEFCLNNPWIFAVIVGVVTICMAIQLIFAISMYRIGNRGALYFIISFIAGIACILLIVTSILLLIYAEVDPVSAITIILISILVGPVVSAAFFTAGFYKLWRSKVKGYLAAPE
jgi:hypothetical protein